MSENYKLEAIEKEELKEPSMYKVILKNDDYTTMEFVIKILMLIFHKTEAEAKQIMLSVHKNGQGICGIYTYDVAETKVRQVNIISEKHKFPLQCVLEEE